MTLKKDTISNLSMPHPATYRVLTSHLFRISNRHSLTITHFLSSRLNVISRGLVRALKFLRKSKISITLLILLRKQSLGQWMQSMQSLRTSSKGSLSNSTKLTSRLARPMKKAYLSSKGMKSTQPLKRTAKTTSWTTIMMRAR
jgi:hypothetical protein